MKIINFQQKKSEILNSKISLKTDGNLALKTFDMQEQKSEYEKPVVKKLTIKRENKKIFMGCYTYSYSANDGDGC